MDKKTSFISKFFILIKNLPKIFKASKALIKSEELQALEKDVEAFAMLEKAKGMFAGKNFRYHLNLGKLYFNKNRDFLAAVNEYEKAISLICTEKNINQDEKEYLLTWAKYNSGWCLYEMKEKEKAEKWRDECEKHYFDIEKIHEKWKKSFPMEWNIDYKL